MNKQMRINDDELKIIKSLFADNETALKLMRKIFLPEVDTDAPIGQVVDIWMPIDVDSISPEQLVTTIKARKILISHLEQCLMQLSVLAGSKIDSVEETKKKLTQNSTK